MIPGWIRLLGLWNGLPAYVAPEAEQAYGLMARRQRRRPETIKTRKALGALDDFAGAIEPVKSEKNIGEEAASFRSATLSEAWGQVAGSSGGGRSTTGLLGALREGGGDSHHGGC